MRNKNANRKYVIGGIILLAASVLIIKLFLLQVVNQSYKLSSSNNSRSRQVEYPGRGMIFDRLGKPLVYNEAVYDLLMIPQQVRTFDTLELCRLVQVDIEELRLSIEKAKSYARHRQSVIVRQIPADLFAVLREKLYKYPGFYVQTRTQRSYPDAIAPHILGYVGEVNQSDIEKDIYYQVGDYIGKSGIEQEYETDLRGEKGIRYLWVDARSQVQGSYEDGRFDTIPRPGANLTLSIDASLQAYGEQLMAHKVGSIVAIEPASGEILAMVTSPAYDPNDLVGRIRGANFERLSRDSLNPMFNRATMSRYSPGSIFKIVQALVGLEKGLINEFSAFACNRSIINCHEHPSARNVQEAIQYSCNPYFYQVYRRIILQGKNANQFRDARIGLAEWRELVMTLGLGQELPVDLPGLKPGRIPDVEYYDAIYGKNRWTFSTIYSNSIGQGEIETVPLQIANLAAIIANRGYYYVPHILKYRDGKADIPDRFKEPVQTPFNPEHFDVVIEGMRRVVNEPRGTGSRAKVPGVIVSGKTGTVQNSHGEDHSGFFAFAPMENPKIAIAVYVENSGAGGIFAATITSLIIEKYLNGVVTQVDKENMVLNYTQF
ncbi:MAG: penicillin-binding protein 2 [Bacteroidales bacterium]|jgi:penicillin-binding protein 2|nr:penicillin-binding protein 2 [Bacteroidales bacterium]MDD2813052.1 penicillin-binding protein 2 [Bacteroidales bacterium]MDD3872090.1 penicillin-binding protein 2 [Bacteroidales bacterium]MDD4813329.1 penicillin-binding protein 2 [Bacteroidales bacterium]